MKASTRLPSGPPRGSAFRDALLSARAVWQRWCRRSRAREQLRGLDWRALADMGIEPEAARQESRKFFWQR